MITSIVLQEVEVLQTIFINIIISLDMVPYEDIDKLHASADIGVALYNPQQHKRSADFTNIAFASGKLMRYLKSGLKKLTTQTNSGVSQGKILTYEAINEESEY